MSVDKNKPTLGFWLEIPPVGNMVGEGICRALAWILRSAQRTREARILIAVPVWAQHQLEMLLRDQNVSATDLEVVFSRRRAPLFLRLFVWMHERGRRPGRLTWSARLRNLAKRIRDSLRRSKKLLAFTVGILATESYVLFGLLLLLASCLALVLAPLALLIWIVWKLALLTRRLLSPLARRLAPLKAPVIRAFTFLYFRVIDHEYKVLAAKAAKRRDISCWFVAQPWAAEARALRGPLVVALWDFVFADFPTGFDPALVDSIEGKFHLLLKRADRVVTSSEYVRDQHAIQHFGVDRSITRVVPITPADYTDRLASLGRTCNGDVRRAAAQTIRGFLRSKADDDLWNEPQVRRWLLDFPIDEVQFLFNSSQIRPHKNVLNLLKAFEILLRRRYLNVKLFLTGRLDRSCPEVLDFVHGRRLHLDVISVPDLPSDVHAAFYALSALTVAPSLFEAGLPIMFSESVSSGTPIVMSSMPQTLELIPPDLAKTMLFNPYDVNDIAKRIAWALENREELLRSQKRLYAHIRERTTDDMGREYLKIMTEASALGRP
ncbi:MAG: glycosyltransferase [Planctomycetota bacterium]